MSGEQNEVLALLKLLGVNFALVFNDCPGTDNNWNVLLLDGDKVAQRYRAKTALKALKLAGRDAIGLDAEGRTIS